VVLLVVALLLLVLLLVLVLLVVLLLLLLVVVVVVVVMVRVLLLVGVWVVVVWVVHLLLLLLNAHLCFVRGKSCKVEDKARHERQSQLMALRGEIMKQLVLLVLEVHDVGMLVLEKRRVIVVQHVW
jgi:hypothetical protein